MKAASITYTYRNLSRGILRAFWSLVRILLIRLFNDPGCYMMIHGRKMFLPLSHALPSYMSRYKFYDRLPRRISEFLHRKKNQIKCIDVGANIGDTVAAFYGSDKDTFLAIEPNPRFFAYLQKNWNSNKNVKAISVICSSSAGSNLFSIHEKDGTASITQTDKGNKMTRQPLDDIINNYPDFAAADVIKIDTDGHDFEVIAGAATLIAKGRPAVLFECDVFGNTKYVEECLNTLSFFKKSGYGSFMLYDNFGNLMGKFSLSDLSSFSNLLFYQLTTNFQYFDILVMKDEEINQFYTAEIEYFASNIEDTTLQNTAKAVLVSQ